MHAHDVSAIPGGASWRTAAQATLHCLTGCAIGEVLGMVIGTALGLHAGTTVVVSIALAFVFGYGLTMRGVLRSGLTFGRALRVALAADTLSIAVMEIVDNAVIVAVPGAMDAGLNSPLFWGSLIASLAVAFVVTTPVNRWMIARGRGHAVVHGQHGTRAARNTGSTEQGQHGTRTTPGSEEPGVVPPQDAVVDGVALSGGGCGTVRCWPASAVLPETRGCCCRRGRGRSPAASAP